MGEEASRVSRWEMPERRLRVRWEGLAFLQVPPGRRLVLDSHQELPLLVLFRHPGFCPKPEGCMCPGLRWPRPPALLTFTLPSTCRSKPWLCQGLHLPIRAEQSSSCTTLGAAPPGAAPAPLCPEVSPHGALGNRSCKPALALKPLDTACGTTFHTSVQTSPSSLHPAPASACAGHTLELQGWLQVLTCPALGRPQLI